MTVFGQSNIGGSVVCHSQKVPLKGRGTLFLSLSCFPAEKTVDVMQRVQAVILGHEAVV